MAPARDTADESPRVSKATLSKNYPVFCDPAELARGIVDWRCPTDASDLSARVAALHGAICAALETRGRKLRRQPTSVVHSVGVATLPEKRETVVKHLTLAIRAGISLDDLFSFADPLLWELPTEGEVRVYLGGLSAQVFCREDDSESERKRRTVHATFDVQAYETVAKALATQGLLGQSPTITRTAGAITLKNRAAFTAAVEKIDAEIGRRIDKTALFAAVGSASSNAASVAIANRIAGAKIPENMKSFPGMRCFLPDATPPVGNWLLECVKGPLLNSPRVLQWSGKREGWTETSGVAPVGVVAMRAIGEARQILLLIAGIDMAATLLAAQAYSSGRLSRRMRECRNAEQAEDLWVWREPQPGRPAKRRGGPAADDDLVGVQAVYPASVSVSERPRK